MAVKIVFRPTQDLTPFNFTDAVGHQLAEDMTAFVDTQLGPAWGQSWQGHYQIVYLPLGQPEPPADAHTWLFNLVGNSTVQGAAGWHSIDQAGHIIGEIAVGTILDVGMSVSAVASHEIAETLVNRFVDAYILTQHGEQNAMGQMEACDPVERFSYAMNNKGRQVIVSDFCLPSYFHSAGQPPYSFRSNAPAPFTPAPGGRQFFLGISGQLADSARVSIFSIDGKD